MNGKSYSNNFIAWVFFSPLTLISHDLWKPAIKNTEYFGLVFCVEVMSFWLLLDVIRSEIDRTFDLKCTKFNWTFNFGQYETLFSNTEWNEHSHDAKFTISKRKGFMQLKVWFKTSIKLTLLSCHKDDSSHIWLLVWWLLTIDFIGILLWLVHFEQPSGSSIYTPNVLRTNQFFSLNETYIKGRVIFWSYPRSMG